MHLILYIHSIRLVNRPAPRCAKLKATLTGGFHHAFYLRHQTTADA